MKNPHEGHRLRMKEEFLAHGFDKSTPPHKVLELLLFYCIPRCDTNVIAHELIDKYKTLSGVLDAPIEEILQFKGFTRKNVGLLKMIMPIAAIYRDEKQTKLTGFSDYCEIGQYLSEKFSGLTSEKFGVLFLDAAGRCLGFEFLGDGELNSVGIPTRKLISRVIESHATAVILAHNHPSGIALPSYEDAQSTKSAAETLAKIDAKLLDHIIVVEGDYVSMRQSEDYSYIFK